MTGPARWRRPARACAPYAWLGVVAFAYLAPALAHGRFLGPYDILGQVGLTATPHALVHNPVGSDEIEEFIPWQVLAWRQVHAGHLPLWNPFSLLGLPLAFNFQSAPFSLSVAVGYALPLRLAHTATVVVRLLVAGSGAYVACRVMRLRVLSALTCATIYELSGGLTIWLGSYEAGCLGFMGWVLAASVLVRRGEHRARDVSLLAVALALLLYSGEPQIALLALSCLAVLAVVMATAGHRRSRGAIARPLVDHGIAVLAAVGLASPVYLPGMQLALRSARATAPPVMGLPLYDLTHLLFGTYNGSPAALGQLIGPDNLYVSMIYVGVVGIALALVGIWHWRERVEVLAFGVLTALLLVLLFAHPVVVLMSHIAYLRVFRILLATTLLDFGLAVLAGFGCEALLSSRGGRSDRPLGLVVASLAALLAALGLELGLNVHHLGETALRGRAESFAWPVASLATLSLVVIGRRWGSARGSLRQRRSPRHDLGLRRARHRARTGSFGLGVLLVVETGFLVSTGAGIWSSSSTGFTTSASIASLRREVRGALVGIGTCARSALPDLGIAPDANLAYGVAETAVLDPIVPSAYSASYGTATGETTAPVSPPGLFCAAITSVPLARRFGVSYVLEPPGAPGPPGTTLVARPGGEGLFAVPRSGRATLVALGPAGAHRARAGAPVVEQVVEPGPASVRVTVDARVRSALQLRLTDVPGWQATIDGTPLALRSWHDVMLEAVVPPGRYTVDLTYRPRAFTIGLALALAAVVGLAGWTLWSTAVSRRRRRREELTSA
ncbi:MAG: hypothetical protein ACYCXY_05490 [Acidimicrobiales bacterium]